MKNLHQNILIFIFFVLISVIFFNKDFFITLNNNSQKNYIYPRTIVELEEQGSLLWNPYIYCGFPHLAEINRKHFLNIFTILIFLLQYLFHIPNFIAFNFIYILHFSLAGFFLYLYARAINIGKIGAVLSGLIYTYNIFFCTDAGGTHEFAARVWVGIILFFIEKSFQKTCLNTYYIILAGIFYALQFLSGATQELYYFSIFLCIYFIFRFYLQFKKIDLKILKLFLIFIIGFGISAVQILPTIELAKESSRFYLNKFNLSYAYQYLNLDYLKSIILFDYSRSRVFLGIMTIMLSLIPVFYRKKTPYYYFYLSIIFIFFIISSKHPVSQFLYYHLPAFNFLQKHLRAFYICIFSVAILAGAGIEKLKSTSLKILLLFIFLLQIYPFWKIGIYDRHYNKITEFSANQKRYQALSKKLYTVEPILTNYRIFINQDDVNWAKYKFYLSCGSSDLVLSHYLEFSKTNTCNIDKLRAYAYYNFLLYPNYLKVSGTKYIIFDKIEEGNAKNEGMTPKIENYYENSPLFEKIYEDNLIKGYSFKDSMARVVLVNKAVLIKDKQQILDTLKDNMFEPKEAVILEKQIPAGLNSINNPFKLESKTYITDYQPGKVSINLKTNSKGFLVLSDTYYPGWKAYINGNAAEIYRANYLFRAVYIDKPGEYTVNFIYSPFSFKLGAGISLITLICSLGGIFWLKKKTG
ncbi:MAG: YfhO family protein [Candidatus Omnitrophota bacterium]